METALLVILMLLCNFVSTEDLSASLAPGGNFNVSWSFSETTPDSEIVFTISARTEGWVGLGFSPNGAMTGADLIVAWIDSEGTSHLVDMHGTGNWLPLVDSSQDVSLVSASGVNGVTSFTFKRKINTCDDEDAVIMTSTTRLIYAFGDTDPTNNVLSSSNYHGATKRGVKSVYLLDTASKIPDESLPDDLQYFDLTVTNYHVPATDTTYYCSFHDPPKLDSKHHILSIEPLITEGNEALVHHMVFFACWGVDKEHLKNNNKTEGVCNTSEMPEFASSCFNMEYAWAVGGSKFYWPAHTGVSFGGSNGSSPDYYLLETHYDNPQLLDTWVDSSGLRVTYTSSLRKQDAGTIQVGTVDGLIVPPNPENFEYFSICHASCTEQWIPDDGVTVFGYLLHTHLLGAKIKLDWYSKDGRQSEVLAEDNSYDFNYQENRLLPVPKKLVPGDSLKLTCTYTDSSRNRFTYGGEPSTDEMCLAILNYYPKQQATTCGSYTGINIKQTDPIYQRWDFNTSSTVEDNIKLLEVTNWSKEDTLVLQRSYYETDHYSFCTKLSFHINFPNVLVPISPQSYPDPPVSQGNSCLQDTPNNGAKSTASLYLVYSVVGLSSLVYKLM
ncbi:moxd1 [Bugula neritina]|uniref:Moxd1 n=1 Tax=Bugula neritina TaxID=10212 RepID=A0A7J7JBR2_BUGNE|nr:moxd1 [Bugula neritina]